MATMGIKFSLDGTEKLRELTLYLCQQSETDANFGSTKLNKLLFYSDFSSYGRYGKSITHQEYQKLPFGPAPCNIVPLLEDMVGEKEIFILERRFRGYSQKKPLALREPNLSVFTAQEISVVDKQIKIYWEMTGAQISSQSHQFVGWAWAGENEIIPYVTALAESRELTDKEKSWAHSISMDGVEELLKA